MSTPHHYPINAYVNILNPSKTVVMAIDLQNAYCSTEGYMGRKGHTLSAISTMLPKVETFLKNMDALDVSVIYTRMIEDYDQMQTNAQTKQKADGDIIKISVEGTYDFDYSIKTQTKNSYEVIKNSYDVFTNPQTANLLRNVENIIIVGVTSDLCVDTTVRSAYSRGYNVIIPKELVGTVDDRIGCQVSAFKLWDLVFAHITDSKTVINWIKDINK